MKQSLYSTIGILSSQMQYIVHENDGELCEGSVVKLLDYEVLSLERGQNSTLR